jgi:hypothetical protein
VNRLEDVHTGYTLRTMVRLVNFSRQSAPCVDDPATLHKISYRSTHAIFGASEDTSLSEKISDLKDSSEACITSIDSNDHPIFDVFKSSVDMILSSASFFGHILHTITDALNFDGDLYVCYDCIRETRLVEIGPSRTKLRLVAIDDGGLDLERNVDHIQRIALEAKGPPSAGEDVDEMSDQDFGQTLAQALGARLGQDSSSKR